MKTIALLSDSPWLMTGYATISWNVLNRLDSKKWDKHHFAHNYMGQQMPPGNKTKDGIVFDFNIHGNGREQYMKDILEIKIKELNLDVFGILLDTFMLYPWLLDKDLAPAKTFFYFPSDGGSGIPLNCEKILQKVDLPIAMAKFGKRQVEKMYGIKCEYIPHGVETDFYKPLPPEDKIKLRTKWGLKDKFVVGVVARNQGRKMLDRTIKAMALFSKECPEAILLMHCDPQDPAQATDLLQLIHRYRIENRVIFTGTKWYKGFGYSEMNDIYNLMDVFLLTTSGEGFGIPIIEAMSCEVPVLATDYTTTRELVIEHNAGEGIDLVGTESEENPEAHCYEVLDGTLTGSWNVERGLCSIKDAVKKLKKLWKDPELREAYGRNGREAVLTEYDWDIVAEKWKIVLERLADG